MIIKNSETYYHPNDRSIKWIKLKADYIEGLLDTLDVIIVGGYFGKGERWMGVGNWEDRITHYLIALASKIDKEDPKNSIFIPFTKVGVGLSHEEL